MTKLKFRFFDDDKVIAQQESNNIDDFEPMFNDLKLKYRGKK